MTKWRIFIAGSVTDRRRTRPESAQAAAYMRNIRQFPARAARRIRYLQAPVAYHGGTRGTRGGNLARAKGWRHERGDRFQQHR
ncbi:MAG: hypothetical protein AMXMBFR77_28290 [Phycisphaerales bacterium]|nr:MAG: hypothetical protein BroJett004_27330 [Planctomycetota bacterium]